MTLFTISIIPVVVVTGSFFGAILRKLSSRAQTQNGIVAGVAAEAFQNIRTVKVFAMEDAEARFLLSFSSLVVVYFTIKIIYLV